MREVRFKILDQIIDIFIADIEPHQATLLGPSRRSAKCTWIYRQYQTLETSPTEPDGKVLKPIDEGSYLLLVRRLHDNAE